MFGGGCKNLTFVFAHGGGGLNCLVIRRLWLENSKLTNSFENKKYLFSSTSEY
jgi:hypothetical protein